MKDPLQGITLEAIVTDLVQGMGWAAMGEAVNIRCFTNDPSIKSSLAFLRKTPWARKKVERLFLQERRKAVKERRIATSDGA